MTTQHDEAEPKQLSAKQRRALRLLITAVLFCAACSAGWFVAAMISSGHKTVLGRGAFFAAFVAAGLAKAAGSLRLTWEGTLAAKARRAWEACGEDDPRQYRASLRWEYSMEWAPVVGALACAVGALLI